jgi:ribose transport system substrate-binding protein
MEKRPMSKSRVSRLPVTILLTSIMLLVAACGGSSGGGSTSTGSSPAVKKTIGFSVYDMQYGYFQDMEKGTRTATQAAGYNYKLVDEKSSESTMVSSATNLINQGINALIISPFQPDALGPIVTAAHQKNIPVVVDDIGGGNSAYDAIVISNNEQGGVIAATQMDKLIKAKAGASKDVASITCEPSAVYAARRNAGFAQEMKTLGYNVVATISANSQQEQGYKVMKDILAAHPNISGVFTCNDPEGVGAAQALADSGKSGSKDVFVVGFNGDKIALDAIKAGQMAATIQQQPTKMGEMTVSLATQLLNHQSIHFDNAANREIYVPVNLITSANLPASS